MKIYNTQKEIEADIVNGVLKIEGDVTFNCSFKIDADIIVNGNIIARDITAWNIYAWNIYAWNINAWDINAGDIDAEDISFYAVCFAYNSFTCKSIKGKRENSKYFCLDSEVVIK